MRRAMPSSLTIGLVGGVKGEEVDGFGNTGVDGVVSVGRDGLGDRPPRPDMKKARPLVPGPLPPRPDGEPPRMGEGDARPDESML